MSGTHHLGPPPPTDTGLSIGDVSGRTGVAVPTLRMWEARYGFPQPERLPSGHRRYADSVVDVVIDVLRRRDSGTRIAAAIEQARAGTAVARPGTSSVFAQLHRSHPEVPVQRLRKDTLMAMSWAIEDEFFAGAEPAHLFGAFQRRTHARAARARWSELAQASHRAFSFADFEEMPAERLQQVALPPQHPMLREWAVVCDSSRLPVALSAWELPGQHSVADRDRVFEAVWTVESRIVREAALTCATVAVEAGAPGAREAIASLHDLPPAIGSDVRSMAGLMNRMLAYVDVMGRR